MTKQIFKIFSNTHLPSLGALPGEFGEHNLLFRMLLLVLLAARLHEECVRGHATTGLAIVRLTTAGNFVLDRDLLHMLIVLIILMVLDLLMFLYVLIL